MNVIVTEIKTKWIVSDLPFAPNAFKQRNSREKLCEEVSGNIQNKNKLIINENLHHKSHNAPSIVKHLTIAYVLF